MSTTATGSSLARTFVPQDAASRWVWYVILAVVGATLLTLSAKIKVPFWPVPMTLQTFAVFAIAAAYGMRLGTTTVALYLAQGAAGLPVFTGTPEKGIGLAYMMGPTGGYLVGFLVAAAIVGWAADRGWSRSPVKLGGAMLIGELVILILGVIWLAWLFGADKAIGFGIGPFIVTDLVKLALAAVLVPALWSVARRLRG